MAPFEVIALFQKKIVKEEQLTGPAGTLDKSVWTGTTYGRKGS